MPITEVIRDTALLGYVLGGILAVLGIAALVGLVIDRGRDDRFTPIGSAMPTPPRGSPFVPGRASDAETSRQTTAAPSKPPTTHSRGGRRADKS